MTCKEYGNALKEGKTYRINVINGKISYTQQDNKCTLRGDKDEMNNHIENDWNKRELKIYETRENFVGWELGMKFKFDKCICTN